MKIIVNAAGTALFTVGAVCGNQFINISKVEVDGTELYSVGVENISFGLYKKEKRAIAAFKAVVDFLRDDVRDMFRFESDKG
jgi:hypothetical protein